jgi:hypothetical protein
MGDNVYAVFKILPLFCKIQIIYLIRQKCKHDTFNYCDGSQEGKSRLADSEVGLELDILVFDASS